MPLGRGLDGRSVLLLGLLFGAAWATANGPQALANLLWLALVAAIAHGFVLGMATVTPPRGMPLWEWESAWWSPPRVSAGGRLIRGDGVVEPGSVVLLVGGGVLLMGFGVVLGGSWAGAENRPLAPLVFGLGVLVLLSGVRARRRRHAYEGAIVLLPSFPLFTAGEIQVGYRAATQLAPASDATFTLQCLTARIVYEAGDETPVMDTRVEWKASRSSPVRGGEMVQLTFQLPDTVRGTQLRLTRRGDWGTFWELMVGAGDYAELFLLPIYDPPDRTRAGPA